MGLILNATNEEQTVKVFGNYFTLKPKQIKNFQDNIASFMAKERAVNGLVQLPEAFEDMEYRTTEEGKSVLENAEEKGIDNYVGALRERIFNNQVSLRQDLEKANQKIDPAALASAGELEAMRIVAKYERAKSDREQQKIDEVKKLMKDIGPVSK